MLYSATPKVIPTTMSQFVINVTKSSTTDEHYVVGRNAVDFGLLMTAQLSVEYLAKKIPAGGLRSYTQGRILQKYNHDENSCARGRDIVYF